MINLMVSKKEFIIKFLVQMKLRPRLKFILQEVFTHNPDN